jgi:sortase A
MMKNTVMKADAGDMAEEQKQNSENRKNKTEKNGKNKKKGSSLYTIVLLVILLIGLGVISYPTFSDWWNSWHASKAIANYVEYVQQLDDSDKQEMLEKAREYNEALETGVNFELTDEEYAEYESVLDVSGTGIMGYIQIPSINVNLPIYHGTDEAVLQIAVGHIAGSSLPIGGKGTHAVLSGHRGLPSARLFTDLDKMSEGDIFTINVLDEVVTYQVDQIRIVLPEETGDLAIEAGKDYCTLVTCTPYGINTHRMLVRGHRIDNLEEDEIIIVNAEASKISSSIVIFAVGIPLVVIVLVIMIIRSSVGGHKKTEKDVLDELRSSEKEK